jgi:N6-L-threonylcarbamoyladenine synthase
MRGEVYPALFRCSGGAAERLTPDRVAAPPQVAREWAETLDEPVVLIGNGMAKYADVFSAELGARAIVGAEETWWPSGSGLFAALAAQGAAAALATGDPGAVLPIYTRLSDAEENEAARAGGAAGVPASGVAGDAEVSAP